MGRMSAYANITEKDLSTLPAVAQESPFMYVGLFEKGKAFVPTVYTDKSLFYAQCGKPTIDFKAGYAANERISQGGIISTVRILGQSGYIATPGYAITSGNTIVAIIRSTNTLTITGTVTAFSISGSSGFKFDKLSLHEADSGFIGNAISSIPNLPSTTANSFAMKSGSASASIYIDKIYPYFTNNATGSILMHAIPTFNEYLKSYSNSKSTMVVSQLVGSDMFDLFRVNTYSDGTSSIPLKIAIDNINTKTGKFSLSIRDFNDTDLMPVVFETWSNLSMDVESDRFIGKVIGDSSVTVDGSGQLTEEGNYPNKSAYIYLTDIATVFPNGQTIVPYGFAGYCGAIDSTFSEPPLILKLDQKITGGVPSKKIYFGVDFSQSGTIDFLKAKPTSATIGSTTAYKGFTLSTDIINYPLAANFVTVTSVTSDCVALDKFVFPVCGGFDGFNEELANDKKLDFVHKATTSTYLTTGNVLETVGYDDFSLAIDAISYPDFVDFKMLFTPAIYQKEAIDYALDMIESRRDAFYVPDFVKPTAEISEITGKTDNYNSSYCGCFYPGIKQKDTKTGIYNWIDTSIVMSGIFTYNDSIAKPWYAAAGWNRGQVSKAYIAYKKLSKTQRNVLSENRVNPIATFNSNGLNNIVVWGNQTLQKAESALSDINIRRMLIESEKFVTSVIIKLLFEPNDQNLYDSFVSTTTPYFNMIKASRGLYDFRVIMDNYTTTDDDRDNNRANGSIIIKPTKSTEEINIGYTITRQNANFNEL